MIAAVVPAAGRATRFGAPKLLAPIEGVAMIDRTVASLLDAGVDRVVVVLGPASPIVEAGAAVLADPRISTVLNPDPGRGMLSSIRAGLAAVAGDAPVLVLPADMPFVRVATVAAVIDAARHHDVVVSPIFDGRRGHPIALTAAAARGVSATPDDVTLSEALEPFKRTRIELPVDDPGIHRDVDRPADLDDPAR